MKQTYATVVALVLAFAAPVQGSERSQILSSRGLIEFHAGRYSEALEWFEKSVASDERDAAALYYRAATRARMNDYDAAIADLNAALSLQPELDEAALDLGVALIETERYADALPWLEQAQQDPALAPRASLFLGLAQLRLGQLDAARHSFERAAADPQQQLAARYYQGIVAYQQRDFAAAEERFTEVAQSGSSSALVAEARTFLTRIAERGGRWYQLSANAGLQYDSNVILAPSIGGGGAESTLDVSQQADGAVTLSAGAGVTPLRTPAVELFLSYDFYQSLYFELHEFDIQDHGVTAEMSRSRGPLQFGLATRYDYYLLETDSFLQEVTSAPWLWVKLGDLGRSELGYRMRWRDYKQQAYRVRNAINHSAGLRQLFYLGSPDRYLSVGYQFDYEDPQIDEELVAAGLFAGDNARAFGYYGHEFNSGVGAALPADFFAEVGYVYRHERYASESEQFLPSGRRRVDDQHQLVAALRRPLGRHVTLVVAYLADFNTSRDVRFDYDRHVAFVSLEVKI